MSRKKLWIGISILATMLIIIVITVTLVLVLRKKHKSSKNEAPPLDEIISNNSTFPDGSYQITVDSLKTGDSARAPLLINLTMLDSIGFRVDNSSLIAETDRLSYFFIRLPPNHDSESVGIRFGDSPTINVIPLNISLVDSSVALLGTLPDGSLVYKVDVRMGDAMCANSGDGSCLSVQWTPYSISSENRGVAASFRNELPIACGSQCDTDAGSPCAASCTSCDGQQVAGSDTPVTRRYKMNAASAEAIKFTYDTYTIKDRITVSYNGENIFDSGCVGEAATTMLSYKGKSMELRVDVEPNCITGTSGTAWDFILPCIEQKTLGFDATNNLTVITLNQFACMANANYEFFVGRITRSTGEVDTAGIENIKNALQSGLWANAYIYPCRNCESPHNQTEKAIKELLTAVPNFDGIVWFDVEVDTKAPWTSDVQTNRDIIDAFASALDIFYPNWGMYTRTGQWASITENWMKYSYKPLWAVNVASTDRLSFAGWTALMSQAKLNLPSNQCQLQIDENHYFG